MDQVHGICFLQVSKMDQWLPTQHIVTDALTGASCSSSIQCDGPDNIHGGNISLRSAHVDLTFNGQFLLKFKGAFIASAGIDCSPYWGIILNLRQKQLRLLLSLHCNNGCMHCRCSLATQSLSVHFSACGSPSLVCIIHFDVERSARRSSMGSWCLHFLSCHVCSVLKIHCISADVSMIPIALFADLKFNNSSRMKPRWLVFVLTLPTDDVIFVQYMVPTVVMSRQCDQTPRVRCFTICFFPHRFHQWSVAPTKKKIV